MNKLIVSIFIFLFFAIIPISYAANKSLYKESIPALASYGAEPRNVKKRDDIYPEPRKTQIKNDKNLPIAK